MPESLKITITLPSSPKKVYTAWLDSGEHTAFTGDKAVIDPTEGGRFTAGNDYITGVNLRLKPYKLIVQSWRTTEFPGGSEDSQLELTFQSVGRGTKLTLRQTNIPGGQGEYYRDGWKTYYFKPMKGYFSPKKKR